MFQFIKKIAGRIKTEMTVLYLASRHPGIGWPLRIYLLLIIAYFLSPVDLIPDFIPVIGYLDDAVLLPVLIFIAFKFIPDDIAAECRQKAELIRIELKKKSVYVILVAAIWLIVLAAIIILGVYAYKN